MDGGRVVHSSSALNASKGTLVTLRWSIDRVMHVYLNGNLVGVVPTGFKDVDLAGDGALRFAVQFWGDCDQIQLKSHNLAPGRADAVRAGQSSSNMKNTASADTESAISGSLQAGDKATPHIPAGKGKANRFAWGCTFECACTKSASWNTAWNEASQTFFTAPPLVPACGCGDCTATSVLRNNQPWAKRLRQQHQDSRQGPTLSTWPRRVPSPPRDAIRQLAMLGDTAAVSILRNEDGLRPGRGARGGGACASRGKDGSRLSHRNEPPGESREWRRGRRSAIEPGRSTCTVSVKPGRRLGTRAGGNARRTRCTVGQSEAFVEYLGVKYPVSGQVLQGVGTGAMLAHLLETNASTLLKDVH